MPPPPRVLDHPDPGRRRARLAAAAGVLAGGVLVWGSLAALDRFVLGFHAWPSLTSPPPERLVVPDTSAATIIAGGGGAPRLLLPRASAPLAGLLILRRGNRLSVTPVTRDEWRFINALA